MSTPAVTVEAPAVSSPRQSEHSTILSTDKHYRMTGEQPAARETSAEKPEASAASTVLDTKLEAKVTPSTKADASAASESDTAAASEAAKAAEEAVANKGKTSTSSESRWQKLSRENKELKEQLNARIARLETAPPARDDKQTSQPAVDVKTTDAKATAHAKPKINDLDPKTGKAKFANYAEYEDAKDGWLQDEAVRKFQETSATTAKAQQLSQAEQIIEQTVNQRVIEAKKVHADYTDVIGAALAQKNEHGQDALFYTKGSHLDGFFLDSDRGHDVLYEIGKNFDQHKHIFARDAQGRYLLNAVRQVRELAKIENSLPATASDKAAADKAASDKTAAKTSSAKPISQAPPPAHQTSGKGAVGKDAVEEAIEQGDSGTYRREANNRDKRLLAYRAQNHKGK